MNTCSSRLISNMFHQMAQLGKNEFGTGQFARIEAARHTKNNGVADNAGSGAGHNGGRIDFVHTEYGKQRAKCGQLFAK